MTSTLSAAAASSCPVRILRMLRVVRVLRLMKSWRGLYHIVRRSCARWRR